MERWITALLFSLFLFAGHAQPASRRIAVSKDIELIQLSESAFVHVSWSELPDYGRFSSNGLIFASKGEAFLFDTPMTDALTRDLVLWITDSLKLKIVGFIPNHWHRDCTGGLWYLQSQQVKSYANQLTIDISRSNNLSLPEVGFKDSLKLMLGGKAIECYYLGAAHSLDNIVVWIPSEKILFAGCMIKSMDANNLGNTADGDLKAYPTTVGLLLKKFPVAKIVIPGHGDFGGLELIRHTLDLLSKQPHQP
jgi:metallo-beta-lactamase class B